MKKIFTNNKWAIRIIHTSCYFDFSDNDYVEKLGADYMLHPLEDQVASMNKLVFDPKKAAALYFWYKSADKTDKSIVKYFEEYKNCIDDAHQWFNSNYGIYAYKQHGIQRCIDVLAKQSNSRQACFCINNNSAMSPDSIDKLCTNTVQFFIRDDALIMLMQMRSSNALTMLPYDFFIFCVWYAQVYNKLIAIYPTLRIANICVQVASLHYYNSDYITKRDGQSTGISNIFGFRDIIDHNFENILEEKLVKFLNN